MTQNKIQQSLLTLISWAFLTTVGVAADHTDTMVTENFPYTNDDGEEIFGAEYRPKSPDIVSALLLIGTPNAGARVPDDLIGSLQSSFIPRFESLSVPGEDRNLRRDSRIPFRRSFSESVSPLIEFENISNEAGVSFNEIATGENTTMSTDDEVVKMTAHFVFVGQGDAAILEFPCGVAVIDTGGEFGNNGQLKGDQVFIDYLTMFFAARPQLNNTIDVVFTTHPHADHLKGLKLLTKKQGGVPMFTIKNVVDNGQTGDSGSLSTQTDFRTTVVNLGASYSAVELARQVTATGTTNNVIDPFECDEIDPIITAFWGGINDALPSDESISTSPYRNPNNHSVIIRVDFGEASFLFTGDLEDRGENDLIEQYRENLGVFDVGVYQVSHHGADDDTSDEFLEIMSPEIAVISMGQPDAQLGHTAWDHGHPRTGLLSVLQDPPAIVSNERDPNREFLAADEQESQFTLIPIKRAIYGTGWEGTVLIEATSTGSYEISSLH